MLKFMKHVVKEWPSVTDATFVLDQHRAHNSILLNEYMSQEGLHTKYLPVASSALNPIELVWATMKRYWKRRVMEINGEEIDMQKTLGYCRPIATR